jgi:Protein of unknown function (DUF2970)
MSNDTNTLSASPLQGLRTVARALFGVRGKADSDRDLQHLPIKQIVLAAVIVMTTFVTIILLIVKTVLR